MGARIPLFIMMISYSAEVHSREEVEAILHPKVREWFSKFKSLTPPQKQAINLIHEGNNVLVSSPTGTGKTLSAFLSIINELFIMADLGVLRDEIYCVYISPLKALNNDVKKNLMGPLSEINSLFEGCPNVRVGVRSGDTSKKERVEQSVKPPHILVTTPESLAILINSPKFVKKLKSLKWLIVDEIHAICDNKRGVHLSLSVERLRELVGKDFVRIGLSATVAPLDEVAKFLVGVGRDCKIVDVSFEKKQVFKVLSPTSDLINTPHKLVNERFYKVLLDEILSNGTTIVFTNTRSGAESVLFRLKQLVPRELRDGLAVHHSSLSKGERLRVEDCLKKGLLKCVLSSTSLELGVDIGSVDSVIQVASPKSVARFLQRVGRSGHSMNAVSKGLMVINDRDELVECAVIVKESKLKRVDKVKIPLNALDVLAQHVVGMSLNKKWRVSEAFDVVRRSYCYRSLSFDEFVNVLKYLSGKYYDLEDAKVYGKIWFDQVDMVFGKRGKHARPIYFMNVGTIPETTSITVYCREGDGSKTVLGSLDEGFVENLKSGDRFVIGGRVYEFVKSKGGVVEVVKAWDKAPTIPVWVSEMLPLSFDLAISVGKFREELFNRIVNDGEEEVLRFLMDEYECNSSAAITIYNYFLEMLKFLRLAGVSVFPSDKNILVENYFDEEGVQRIVFHTLYGRKVNEVLSKCYGYALGKLLNRNIRTMINDNGFVIMVPEGVSVNPEQVVKLVNSGNIGRLAHLAVGRSEILKRRFRHVAARGFMILKNYMGYKKTVNKQQVNSEIILEMIKEVDGFPILKEAYREVLEDAMDLSNAKKVIERLDKGEYSFVVCKKLTVPSPFAHNLVLLGRSDVLNLESKREILKRFHQQLSSNY